jgi:hypothetical protein
VVNPLQKLEEKEGGRTRFFRLLQAATAAPTLTAVAAAALAAAVSEGWKLQDCKGLKRRLLKEELREESLLEAVERREQEEDYSKEKFIALGQR